MVLIYDKLFYSKTSKYSKISQLLTSGRLICIKVPSFVHLVFLFDIRNFEFSNFEKFRISKFLQLSNVISKLIKNVISFRFSPDFDFFLRSTCPEFQP